MGSEKRRYKRFKVDVMEINGTMLFANEVEILDLSLGGVALKADRRLNIGNEYEIKIRDKTGVIPVRAAVVWSLLSGTRKRPDGESIPIYSAGMRFTNLSGDKITELKTFMELHRREEQAEDDVHELSGLRFNVRFALDAAEKALIDYPETYGVKKIGIGGMLIESTREIAAETRLPMELSLSSGAVLRFEGRVASCLPRGDFEPKTYDIGIEFMGMPEGDRTQLREFIRRLTTYDEGSLSM
ncbi:MAG: PilZ domain-containing protein [Nitrospirae bacterium]|nr:PilZ domain-containing protein [Nitrospirota bacterium]